MNDTRHIYKITKKEYGIIIFEQSGLTFNEAYNICTPDYTRGIYPNNKWHVMMKYPVYKLFQDNINLTTTVSYETLNKDTDIKIREFILSNS